MTEQRAPLVGLQNITKRFVKSLDLTTKVVNWLGGQYREEVVHAVDDVSFTIGEGEVVGLVGESGCGKSTIGRMVAGILEPTKGSIQYRGEDLLSLPKAKRRSVSLKSQMIFQDPFASLNPRMRVKDIIGEAPVAHKIVSSAELDDYLDEIMNLCGLEPGFKRRYAHQFSGGQRQRIGIARALAVKPDFLICDEAVAALDVSIQAQILNLFMKLREELGLTYLLISHDLGVVEHLSDRVIIMYLGRLVEVASAEDLFRDPNHPYTKALLEEVPRIESRRRTFAPVKGEIPSPINPPSGCYFHPRCNYAQDICREESPELVNVAAGDEDPHLVRCHFQDTLNLIGIEN